MVKELLNDQRFKEHKLISNDALQFIANGFRNLVPVNRQQVPSVLDELQMIFDYHFGRTIAYTFFMLGRDHWRKEAKIAVFLIMTLGPIIALVIRTMVLLFCNPKIKKQKTE